MISKHLVKSVIVLTLLWLSKLFHMAKLCLVSSLCISFLLNPPTTLSILVDNFPDVRTHPQTYYRFYSFSLTASLWPLLLDGLLLKSVAQYCSETYCHWSAMLDFWDRASFFIYSFFFGGKHPFSSFTRKSAWERNILHLPMSKGVFLVDSHLIDGLAGYRAFSHFKNFPSNHCCSSEG